MVLRNFVSRGVFPISLVGFTSWGMLSPVVTFLTHLFGYRRR